jgi:hypothetical protein
VTAMPLVEVYMQHLFGVPSATLIELTGSFSSANFGYDGLNNVTIVPSLRFASFNAFDTGLTNQVSTEPPAATPEPSGLALIMFGPISLLASLRRRR